MKTPLKIKALSLHSCLGKGAEFNASAMRCNYDGFEETDFMQNSRIGPQIGASMKLEVRGIKKLTYLCQLALEEILKQERLDFSTVPIYICLQEKEQRPMLFDSDELLEALTLAVSNQLSIKELNESSKFYFQDRCGLVTALEKAQDNIYTNDYEHVLIISIDTLLNAPTLSYYGGDLYGDGCRLLTDDNSNGFIPGEASTAILLSKPTGEKGEVLITGVGTAKESASFENEEEVLKGNGLTQAIDLALDDANSAMHEMAFRVSSLSGEEYFFNEASLAQTKTLTQKVSTQPLLHPADSIGEVGASIGGAMVVQTYYSFVKKYALGKKAICHISNDDELRGAFVMEYHE